MIRQHKTKKADLQMVSRKGWSLECPTRRVILTENTGCASYPSHHTAPAPDCVINNGGRARVSEGVRVEQNAQEDAVLKCLFLVIFSVLTVALQLCTNS